MQKENNLVAKNSGFNIGFNLHNFQNKAFFSEAELATGTANYNFQNKAFVLKGPVGGPYF